MSGRESSGAIAKRPAQGAAGFVALACLGAIFVVPRAAVGRLSVGHGAVLPVGAPMAEAAVARESDPVAVIMADGIEATLDIRKILDDRGVRAKKDGGRLRWWKWKVLSADSAFALRGRLLSKPPTAEELIVYGAWCERLNQRDRAFEQYRRVLRNDFNASLAHRGVLRLQGLPPFAPLSEGVEPPALGQWITPRVSVAVPLEFGARPKPLEKAEPTLELDTLIREACADFGVALMPDAAGAAIAVTGSARLSLKVTTFLEEMIAVRADVSTTLKLVKGDEWERSCAVTGMAQKNAGPKAMDEALTQFASRVAQSIRHYAGPRKEWLDPKPTEGPDANTGGGDADTEPAREDDQADRGDDE